ncbi:hypothetical protein HMPREF9123_1056 [Neisseria bacilliformis ATCC BAA-1200]|uniref:Uncharacterized protein n=1 Tax=Neisseria bacilliformis ATCC BAA-1200 TaxID=888742 RepID=F2BBF1_9NEIS|nr:hypothetical protein HMPREF9123_1056 [Neisseria bacilliformis ATCC BAA-1200]
MDLRPSRPLCTKRNFPTKISMKRPSENTFSDGLCRVSKQHQNEAS